MVCITPLLKKLNILIVILKNDRPVSNLPKIIEQHVDSQMTEDDEKHNLPNDLQSAYTKFSSTKIVLLRVQKDLLMAIDTKGSALFILLDFASAFDTIDYQILLNHLEYAFGLKEEALASMTSYMTE